MKPWLEIESGGKLKLGGMTVFDRLVPLLSLELDGTAEERPMLNLAEEQRSEDGKLARFRYEDQEKSIALTVTFTHDGEEDVVVGSIHYESASEMVGGKCRTLHAREGIRLLAGQPGQPDSAAEPKQRYMALHLHKDWWTRPAFGSSWSELPPRTQSLTSELGDGRHMTIVPITGPQLKTEIIGAEDETGLYLNTSAYAGGYANMESPAFAIALGDSPFDSARLAMKYALEASGSLGKLREERRYPEMFEYLGWCSWDAFYYDISEQGLLDKAAELKEKGIPAKWMIIDAGWSDDDDYALKSFEAHPVKFPGGLARTVGKLKANDGMRWVGVWHTLIGYWNGVARNSELAIRHQSSLTATRCGKLVPAPSAAAAFPFWNEWHRSLKQSGIDFVKVDYQSILSNMLGHSGAIGSTAREAHEALEASVSKNFDSAMINCMGMASENVFNRANSALSRNSDDFFPNEPQGFAEHVMQNVYNAVVHGTVFWTDWDMWWTKHSDAAVHSLLRALSGGPIYVSDKVGETEKESLLPLVYSDGRIARADQPGLPTADCLYSDPTAGEIPLKVWNKKGSHTFVGAFHLHGTAEKLSGQVGHSDLAAGTFEEDILVYEHFSSEARVLPATANGEGWTFELARGEAKLFKGCPLHDGTAIIGLADKYLSADGVLESTGHEGRWSVKLREGGRFVWYSESQPSGVEVNGRTAEANRIGDRLYEVITFAGGEPVWISWQA
ncbi:Sip1-related alpha-galactosidase [Paenibacillus sp. JDR-2]|uniref:Sip1-related alpha-galactosidase n=1 Tax=Paenibacillus sp. (strain JDR-2) TaxID=324057 RepID=UPI0001666C12|nr:Sip1-related alpha-galactosidase [Paenibacillus sp. JDR-2]ACT01222.1 raffinose synthase [Paenibacillus sp. JDR-2]